MADFVEAALQRQQFCTGLSQRLLGFLHHRQRIGATSCRMAAYSFMASRMAWWSLPSSNVGETWQYFVPNSNRETHRQTMRFFPSLARSLACMGNHTGEDSFSIDIIELSLYQIQNVWNNRLH